MSEKTKSELQQMLLDVFSASREARRVLEGAQGLSEEDVERLLDTAELKIFNVFHPSRGYYAKSCVAKSNKVITEFKQQCKNPDALARLMVYQVEQIADASGLEWELYSTSFDNRTAACARFLFKHKLIPKYEEQMNAALSKIAEYSFISCARNIDDYLAALG